MKIEDVWTIERLCDYIVENYDKIAVRVELNGKWQSLFLSELPVKLALEQAMRFIKELKVPYIMKGDVKSKP